MQWLCRDDELASAMERAAARERLVQAQSSETSLCNRDLTTRAWNILCRFTFLDCLTPVAAVVTHAMLPPMLHATQHGVSKEFLMETLKSNTTLEA